MRDPVRIDRIIAKLRAYWKLVPDCRLGQIVSNLAGAKDPYYTEDDLIERNLDEWTERVKPESGT